MNKAIIFMVILTLLFLSGCAVSECEKVCNSMKREIGESPYTEIISGECRYSPETTKYLSEHPELKDMLGKCEEKGKDVWCDCKLKDGTYLRDLQNIE